MCDKSECDGVRVNMWLVGLKFNFLNRFEFLTGSKLVQDFNFTGLPGFFFCDLSALEESFVFYKRLFCSFFFHILLEFFWRYTIRESRAIFVRVKS